MEFYYAQAYIARDGVSWNHKLFKVAAVSSAEGYTHRRWQLNLAVSLIHPLVSENQPACLNLSLVSIEFIFLGTYFPQTVVSYELWAQIYLMAQIC